MARDTERARDGEPLASGKLRLLVIGLTLALVAYLLFILWAGFDEVIAGAALLSLGDWLLLLGLSLVHFLLRFARWQGYLVTLGHRVAHGQSLLCYMSGFALTTTPGKVGETVRAVYLKRHGVAVADTFAGFFAERYTDLIAVVALSMLAIGSYEGNVWPLILGCGLVLVLLLGLRLPWLPRMLDAIAERGWAQMGRGALEGLAKMLRSAAQLLGIRQITAATAIALVAWAVQGLVLYLVLEMLGFPLPVAIVIGIYALGILAGALSFLPGGLGSAEAVMILMLVVEGLSVTDATTATLICRIATLWFAVLLGISAMGHLELRNRFFRSAG